MEKVLRDALQSKCSQVQFMLIDSCEDWNFSAEPKFMGNRPVTSKDFFIF